MTRRRARVTEDEACTPARAAGRGEMINADIRGLIARLERAKGGDKDIDRTIMFDLGLGEDQVIAASDYTFSVDAALALVERLLPGTYVELSGPRKYRHSPTPANSKWCAKVGENGVGWSETAPLAIIIAFFKTYERKRPA